MIDGAFYESISKGIEEGQEYFAGHLRLMVQSMNGELFSLLDADNDEIFLNPMLFAFLNADNGKIGLNQILYGSISEEKRPENILVVSNTNGEIYLPSYGYLLTDISEERTFNLITRDNSVELLYENESIPHVYQPILTLSDSSVELQCTRNQLIDEYIGYSTMDSVPESFCEKQKNIEDLERSVDVLKNYYPNYYDLFCKVTKWILPFSNVEMNSFAAMAVHGVGFLNHSSSSGSVFYIEDMVHQCGHVIFGSLTYRPEEYFTIDPNTPIAQFLDDKNDDRTLYVLLHGVFTEAVMCEVFDICVENGIFDGQQKHELMGRFSYIFLRFIVDMEILNKNNYLTQKGQNIYNELYESMMDLYKRYSYLLHSYELTNQTYNFDYEKFAEKNELN